MLHFAAPQGTRHTIRSRWAKRGEEMAFLSQDALGLVSLAPLFLVILSHESREVVQLQYTSWGGGLFFDPTLEGYRKGVVLLICRALAEKKSNSRPDRSAPSHDSPSVIFDLLFSSGRGAGQ